MPLSNINYTKTSQIREYREYLAGVSRDGRTIKINAFTSSYECGICFHSAADILGV